MRVYKPLLMMHVVPGEGTRSEEDRGGVIADTGGARRPESEHLQ